MKRAGANDDMAAGRGIGQSTLVTNLGDAGEVDESEVDNVAGKDAEVDRLVGDLLQWWRDDVGKR